MGTYFRRDKGIGEFWLHFVANEKGKITSHVSGDSLNGIRFEEKELSGKEWRKGFLQRRIYQNEPRSCWCGSLKAAITTGLKRNRLVQMVWCVLLENSSVIFLLFWLCRFQRVSLFLYQKTVFSFYFASTATLQSVCFLMLCILVCGSSFISQIV